MSNMKERPILFSAPMVRALLDGSKTQTRRIVKPQPDIPIWMHPFFMSPKNGKARFRPVGPDWPDSEDDDIYFPYGQPGDRLWVREAFAPKAIDPECTTIAYRATDDECNGPWKPSIHMHRWMSRITLEITEVRVELLQSISEADAKAEGVTPKSNGRYACNFDDGKVECVSPVTAYMSLWTELNGRESWPENPWVWVIEFKVVKS